MARAIKITSSTAAKAARVARARGVSVDKVVEEAVRHYVAANRRTNRHSKLPTYRGKGIQSGIDLNDGAALRDTMDRRA